jgi:quinol-cytochrome oxidoreductase complex cytochrome b subunit
VESRPDGGRRSLLGWVEQRVNLTEIVSFLSVFGLLPTELDSRKPLREALSEALHRPLPSYARWPHVLGILSFILFLFLGLTGTLLAFYYQPTSAEAYRSVTLIARDVALGSLVHQAHRWASIVFLLVLGLRVLRFFFASLYGRGREVIWMATILTFCVAAFTDVTGRLLPWDSQGFWTTVRAREVLDALPGIGPLFAFFVGGSSIDSLILTRFYMLHVFVLPIALLVLFYVHFSSVRRVGMSPVATVPTNRSLRVALYDVTLLVIFMLGGLVTLAVIWPHAFGVAADPLVTLPGAHPPWYLLAPHAVQQLFPSIIPSFVSGFLLEAMFVVVLVLPFLDRSTPGEPRHRLVLGVGLAFCLLWAALTWWGWILEVRR